MRSDCRTKGQNDILVTHVLDELIRGKSIKEVAAKYSIPWNTMASILKRYRKRHGFKNNYHMLAIYVIVRERKGANKPAPF